LPGATTTGAPLVALGPGRALSLVRKTRLCEPLVSTKQVPDRRGHRVPARLPEPAVGDRARHAQEVHPAAGAQHRVRGWAATVHSAPRCGWIFFGCQRGMHSTSDLCGSAKAFQPSVGLSYLWKQAIAARPYSVTLPAWSQAPARRPRPSGRPSGPAPRRRRLPRQRPRRLWRPPARGRLWPRRWRRQGAGRRAHAHAMCWPHVQHLGYHRVTCTRGEPVPRVECLALRSGKSCLKLA